MGWFLSLALGPAGQVPSVFLLVFRWGGKKLYCLALRRSVELGTELTFVANLRGTGVRARSRSPLVSGRCLNSSRRWNAIRKALGLRPAEELPAPLAISEAMVLMGIKANKSWALPERVEALVEALDLPGFGKSPAATQAAAPAPPAPKPVATMPVPASAPSAKALGKRKTTAGTAAGRSLIGPFSASP